LPSTFTQPRPTRKTNMPVPPPQPGK
jgi:hypothetical protein